MNKSLSIFVIGVFLCLITLTGVAVIKLDDVATKLDQTKQELNSVKKGYEISKQEYEAELHDAKLEIQQLNKTTETLQQRNNELRKQVELKDKEMKALSTKAKAVMVMPSRGSKPIGKVITVASTAYTAYCRGCSGKTKTGLNLRQNPNLKVIAVDPNIIPLGSKVYVEGYGYAIAADTGGAIKGHKVDIFMPTYSQAIQWGRKVVQIRILES